jgi:hypothetical protein
MLTRNIFKKINNININNINNINKNIRSYCIKNCPEEDNLFSTTLKVNIFTLILTIGINNNIMSHRNSLEKKIDELNNIQKKLENKK